MNGVFITARHNASRLPGKMLRKVCGRTLLSLVIERAKQATDIDRVVLCTTTDPSDDALVEIAVAEKISVFRGNYADVLLRYQDAAHEFGISTITISDGDDLFCEPSLITKVSQLLRDPNIDYVEVKGMPYGTYPYGMTTAALEKVCSMKDESETEGWGRYFTQVGNFRIHTIAAKPEWNFPEFRLTLDYPEDFELIEKIYTDLYQTNSPIPLGKLFSYLHSHPEIAAINSNRIEEYAKRFAEKYSHVKLKEGHQQ